MKKAIFTMVTLVFLVFLGSAPALAYLYGIGVGDQVKVTGYNHTAVFGGHGGEFTMVADNGYNWITFCVEMDESIYLNNYDWVGGLSDRAIGGGGNSDTTEVGYDSLSDESAWLYWSFWTGTLSGYTTGNTQNQNDLQGLLWYLENEVTGVTLTTGMQTWQTDAFNATDGGWTNTGQVKVVNLYETKNTDGTYTGLRQDVLIAAVPEPATMLLLGSGLIGLAGLGRRKFFKKT